MHFLFLKLDAAIGDRPLRIALACSILLVGLAGGLSGCFSPGAAVQEGLDAAGDAAGQTVGEALGAEIVRAADLPPPGSARYNQVMLSQAQIMFSYAFSAGGMWPAEASYEPGEWTRYRVEATGGETALDTLERAFLKRTDDGNEWWRIRGVQDEEGWVYEALLDSEQEEALRLRTKDPEGEVGEVPVTEETIYRPPRELTEESIEGATEGTESVETPAGTFTARRVEYTGTASGGAVTWFLSEEVPGNVVRYEGRREGEEWTSMLLDYGTDATTRLNAY